MLYRVLADLTLVVHLAFVVFVVGGALLVARWRRLAWIHVPAAAWGFLIELAGWVCPLTPLENWFRQQAGLQGYEGGFIAHYLVPLVYPPGLERHHQIVLGCAVLVVNAVVYGWILLRHRDRGSGRPGSVAEDA